MKYREKIPSTMTKKEIIEEYNRLLEALKEEMAAREEAERRLTELQKRKDRQAQELAREITTSSVHDGIAKLKQLITTTLNELSDRMAEQAERLEQLNRAIELQEARLKELHDIEYAADTMSKLISAYEEERARLESEHKARLAELEEAYAKREEELEKSYAEKKAALEGEIAEERARWEREQEEALRAREREEAEYRYQQERERRRLEEGHADRKAALERELSRLREEAERKLKEREEDLRKREEELERMREEIESFPQRLAAAVEQARQEARAAAEEEMEQRLRLAQLEREWEKKMLEQTIAHLQEVNKSLEEELRSLHQELQEARRQLTSLAERAMERVAKVPLSPEAEPKA
ncbi:hypothetical protein LR090_03745 [Candidatus Bipolaricaulota bacterium]|nr:hypothetical protein [Candidatus Bipolaricaulota bacterium]